MTFNNRCLTDIKKTFSKKQAKGFLSLLLIAAVFTVSLFLSDEISHSVNSGLTLCYRVIIPAVFPFLIISDLMYASLDFTSLNRIGKIFSGLFKINFCGIYSFMLGATCGFPLGVKSAGELYRHGAITKDEAERLIGFSNNTGPAFLICGIGMGLRGDFTDGVILYLSMIISAILCGIIFSIGKTSSKMNTNINIKDNFSLTTSIKNAGISTLSICSFIIFFACIVGLMRKFISESYLYLVLISFVEIGSASSILSKTKLLGDLSSLIITAFAVGFSGISVHLQARSFINDTDISMKKYVLMKFIQGVISSLMIIPLYMIFK